MDNEEIDFRLYDCTSCRYHDGGYDKGLCLRFPPSYSDKEKEHLYPVVSQGTKWMKRACGEFKKKAKL